MDFGVIGRFKQIHIVFTLIKEPHKGLTGNLHDRAHDAR